MKRNKACGVDDLPHGLLRDSCEHICQPLAYIVNLVIQTNKIPRVWKTAKVVPIHKKGSKDNPMNYRPISILPVLSKVLERAIHQQLMKYREENRLTNRSTNRSTNVAATIFVDNIRREVDRGNLVGAVFIDLSKAFDTISHSSLLNKLPEYGIVENELELFTDYLYERQQVVHLGTRQSNIQPVYNGVPQGSILGLLLFIIFYNDFPDCISESQFLMYADDSVIYSAGKNVEEIEKTLTNDLKFIADYVDENELIINLKKGKTEAMLFGTTKRISLQNRQLQINYRNTPINNTERYTYLGYILDKNLTMQENFDKAYKKSCNRLKLLSKLRHFMNADTAQ